MTTSAWHTTADKPKLQKTAGQRSRHTVKLSGLTEAFWQQLQRNFSAQLREGIAHTDQKQNERRRHFSSACSTQPIHSQWQQYPALPASQLEKQGSPSVTNFQDFSCNKATTCHLQQEEVSTGPRTSLNQGHVKKLTFRRMPIKKPRFHPKAVIVYCWRQKQSSPQSLINSTIGAVVFVNFLAC